MIAGILKGVTGFISPYLNYVFIAAIIAMGAVTGVFWFQKDHAEKQVADLTIANDRMSSQIKGLNVSLGLKDKAIAQLESTNTVLIGMQRTETQIQTEITDAPTSDDGPVAPVLDRALDGIGRMLNSPARSAH